jgi:hypothetical protein
MNFSNSPMENTLSAPRRAPASDVVLVLGVGLAAALCAVAVAIGGAIQPFDPASVTASVPQGVQTTPRPDAGAHLPWPKRGALVVQRALCAFLPRRNQQNASAVRRRRRHHYCDLLVQ